MATDDNEWVTLARILRTRGVRGEVLAESFTSGPERFDGAKALMLWREGSERIPVEVEAAREYQGLLILKLAGFDSPEAAEELRRGEIQVPLGERAALAEGEYYQSDLIGCGLVDAASGNVVATVTAFEEFGAAPLLVVKTTDGREEMVPFTPIICTEVRIAEKRIVAELPVGLLDLNRK